MFLPSFHDKVGIVINNRLNLFHVTSFNVVTFNKYK